MMIKKYMSRDKIIKKVKQLAKKIYKDYKKYNEVNFVTVLTGAKYFSKDLKAELRDLGIKVNEDFIKVKSYVGTKSSGKIKVIKKLKEPITGKHILIIEDIVDTGLTLFFLKRILQKKAKSVKICSFLDKPSRREKIIKMDYLGYKVPNKFIVGYGLDFNEKYRELKYIGVLVENK